MVEGHRSDRIGAGELHDMVYGTHTNLDPKEALAHYQAQLQQANDRGDVEAIVAADAALSNLLDIHPELRSPDNEV